VFAVCWELFKINKNIILPHPPSSQTWIPR